MGSVTIMSNRSLGRRIERLRIVRRGDREDVVALPDAVERGEEVGQGRVVAPGVAMAENEIDVVEDDERRPEGVALGVEIGERVPHRGGIREDRRVLPDEARGDDADEVCLADARRAGDEEAAARPQAERPEEFAARRRRREEDVDLPPQVFREDQAFASAVDRRTDTDPDAAVIDARLQDPATERIVARLQPLPERGKEPLGNPLVGIRGKDRELPRPVAVVDEDAEADRGERARWKEGHEPARHRHLGVGAVLVETEIELRPGGGETVTGGSDDDGSAMLGDLESQHVAEDREGRRWTGEPRARQRQRIDPEMPGGELRRVGHRRGLVADEFAEHLERGPALVARRGEDLVDGAGRGWSGAGRVHSSSSKAGARALASSAGSGGVAAAERASA
jgi:hypothetical protein